MNPITPITPITTPISGVRRRLIPQGATIEQEWIYLIAETLSGELAIVPLLEELLADNLSAALQTTLKRQLEEEARHIITYKALLGADATIALNVNGFAAAFSAYVRSLTSRTLKLFALQAMLEGLSLGAIAYRLRNFNLSHTEGIDRRIYLEEEGHTRFGLAHLGEFIKEDGVVPQAAFEAVARETNRIFRQCVTGETISRFFANTFSTEIDPLSIEQGSGMMDARWHGAKIIVGTKVQFLNRYKQVAARA